MDSEDFETKSPHDTLERQTGLSGRKRRTLILSTWEDCACGRTDLRDGCKMVAPVGGDAGSPRRGTNDEAV